MSEENPKYHQNKTIRLKSSLICILVFLACIIGVVIAEDAAYSMTFPDGPYTNEFDGTYIHVDVEVEYSDYIESWYYLTRVNLRTGTSQNDPFPLGVNATRIWIIPLERTIWPWRNYIIRPLKFDNSDTSSYSESSSPYIIDDFDGINTKNIRVIVEVNVSGILVYINDWLQPWYLEGCMCL